MDKIWKCHCYFLCLVTVFILKFIKWSIFTLLNQTKYSHNVFVFYMVCYLCQIGRIGSLKTSLGVKCYLPKCSEYYWLKIGEKNMLLRLPFVSQLWNLHFQLTVLKQTKKTGTQINYFIIIIIMCLLQQ